MVILFHPFSLLFLGLGIFQVQWCRNGLGVEARLEVDEKRPDMEPLKRHRAQKKQVLPRSVRCNPRAYLSWINSRDGEEKIPLMGFSDRLLAGC